MTVTYELSEEVRNELRLLKLQLEHSKEQRRKREKDREDEKRKELAKLKESISEHNDAETGSALSAETVSTVGGSTVGQITVKKSKSGPQRNASVTEHKDDKDEPAPMSPPNAAELKRQREQEQARKKELREAEEQKRVDAQKSDPAKEKGGDVKFYTKGKLRGWNETAGFAVARPGGLFFYKAAPAGRGSTAGGISYDDSAKPLLTINFSVPETNSRGTTVNHKTTCNMKPMVGDHPRLDDKTDPSLHFTVSYFDPKAKGFQMQLVRCEATRVRDSWGAFLSKYMRVQGL